MGTTHSIYAIKDFFAAGFNRNIHLHVTSFPSTKGSSLKTRPINSQVRSSMITNHGRFSYKCDAWPANMESYQDWIWLVNWIRLLKFTWGQGYTDIAFTHAISKGRNPTRSCILSYILKIMAYDLRNIFNVVWQQTKLYLTNINQSCHHWLK